MQPVICPALFAPRIVRSAWSVVTPPSFMPRLRDLLQFRVAVHCAALMLLTFVRIRLASYMQLSLFQLIVHYC